MVHWLLLVVVVGGVGAAVLGGLIWSGKKLLEFYKEDYADTQSLAAFLITLAVAVFFAEPIRRYGLTLIRSSQKKRLQGL